jgi:hypothetical protein
LPSRADRGSSIKNSSIGSTPIKYSPACGNTRLIGKTSKTISILPSSKSFWTTSSLILLTASMRLAKTIKNSNNWR